MGKKKEHSEAQNLFQRALEKCQKAYEIEGHCYNLSCAYALLRNKEDAICYLDKSLVKQEITLEHVLNDEDWKEYLDDEEFKAVIEKYSTEQESAGMMR